MSSLCGPNFMLNESFRPVDLFEASGRLEWQCLRPNAERPLCDSHRSFSAV
jgi:hypothetical protein